MRRSPPSLTTSAIILLAVVVIPLLTATFAAMLVKEWLSVALILSFGLILLLIVVPYIALISDLVSSNIWLKAYVKAVSRVPLLGAIVPSPGHYQRAKGEIRFGGISNCRIQARDWKHLHLEAQEISLKLTVLRGSVFPDNYQILLHDLEVLWQQDCSKRILQFVRLDGLADGVVKRKFISLEHCRQWISELKVTAEELDQLIGECLYPGDLSVRFSRIRFLLARVERTTCTLLSFLDSQLQKSIDELEGEVERARVGIEIT